MSLLERLLRDTEWRGDCLVWTASTTPGGYGQFYYDGAHWLAHRASWFVHHGPPLSQVLHTCDNPPCVNPEHLWSGTQSDNMRDMVDKGRKRGGPPHKTHCIRNHPLSGDNLYLTPDGRPQCKKCQRERVRRWRASR